MKAVIYTAVGEYSYSNTTKEIPTPQRGQVLIKVECCALNPSDLYMLGGKYSGNYSFPLVPGVEGSGTVVASGGGFMAWSIMGKRVAFSRRSDRAGIYSKDGAYAEYIIADAMGCISLDANSSFEKGAGSIVNPISAVGLLDRCLTYKAKAVIQTGAASQLGRMMIRLLRDSGVPLINIVRRDEQVTLLKEKYGAEHVLNSETPDFMTEFKALSKKLGANVCIECVAGDMTGKVVEAIQKNGIVITYGLLSEKPMGGIHPIDFMAKNVRFEGFFLPNWMKEKSTWALLRGIAKAKTLIEEVEIQREFGLH